MDTSEIYIKMSECPEIQNNWCPKKGDYCADCADGSEIWILHTSSSACDNPEWVKKYGKDIIFLPRQDQIQEMLGKNVRDSKILVHGFLYQLWKFCERPLPHYQPKSFEQLWLAFYMWEKHKKIWDGKKWTKSK